MNRKNLILTQSFALLLIASLSSCDLIEGIFKGGVYVGVIIVLLVIGLIFWLVRSAKK